MMAGEALAYIKTSLEIAKGARDLIGSSKDRGSKDAKLSDSICQALRFIYFPENSVLGLLKDILAGEKISDERRERVLTEFNDYEWKVGDILRTLSFDSLEKELGLTLASIRMLSQIRHGKARVREAVQREINAYGQKRYKTNRARIEELVKNIESLNATIEQVEATVNRRASSGGG